MLGLSIADGSLGILDRVELGQWLVYLLSGASLSCDAGKSMENCASATVRWEQRYGDLGGRSQFTLYTACFSGGVFPVYPWRSSGSPDNVSRFFLSGDVRMRVAGHLSTVLAVL